MRYTVRHVPEALDSAIRRRAREQGKSLNETVIEALTAAMGMSGRRGPRRDLRDIAGTWRDDPEFDRAVAAQDRRDTEF